MTNKKTPYTDDYKERYESHMRKKQQQRQNPLPTKSDAPITPIEKVEKIIEKEVKESEKIIQEVKEKMARLEGKAVKEITKIEEEIVKDGKKAEEFIINQKWVIIGSLLVIILIFAGIYLFTTPSVKAKYTPLDVVISNLSGMPSSVYFDGKNSFGLTGFESKLTYNNKQDRLFGNEQYKKIVFDEQGKAYSVISLDGEIRLEPLTTNPDEVTKIGWFSNPSQISLSESISWGKKQVSSILSSGAEVNSAELTYSLFKGRPYMKVEFSASAENSSNLGDFAFGLVIQNSDIYLDNGTILRNDNLIATLNKTVDTVIYENGNSSKNISETLENAVSQETDTSRQARKRSGSSYNLNPEYEIFYNQNTSRAIIVYSPESARYENLFLWNVFRVYIPYNEGYSPLYLAVLDNTQLSYDEQAGDWRITSNKIDEYARFYINQIVSELG